MKIQTKIANKSSKMAVFRWKRLFLDHGASIEVHYVFGNWILEKNGGLGSDIMPNSLINE